MPGPGHRRLATAVHLDKFTGGTASTVFGSVPMQESGWNRTLAVHLSYRLAPSLRLGAGVEVFTPSHGGSAWFAGLQLHAGIAPATSPLIAWQQNGWAMGSSGWAKDEGRM